MKRSHAITASRRPRSTATSSDSTPRTRRRGRWQVARTAARSTAPKGARLAPAALTGGPPIAREDPGRSFPGRARLDGEAGAEARRGHRRRRARRRSSLLVEFGEVAGQGRVLGTLVGGGSGMDSGDSRGRGGEHSSPPRAVEEVTGQPLTGQKPARLSGMGWLRAG